MSKYELFLKKILFHIPMSDDLYSVLECGKTFQDNSASFTSPSYHLATPSQEPEACEWRITATHGEKIILNITDLVRTYSFSS